MLTSNLFQLVTSLSLRLQGVLQVVCVCLSADSRLHTISECVSILTSLCDHPSLARHVCSQHGEAPPPATAQDGHTSAVCIQRSRSGSSSCFLCSCMSADFCLCFLLRPVCFPEVVPVHQNQNRPPGDKRRLDSAGPAGRTHAEKGVFINEITVRLFPFFLVFVSQVVRLLSRLMTQRSESWTTSQHSSCQCYTEVKLPE